MTQSRLHASALLIAFAFSGIAHAEDTSAAAERLKRGTAATSLEDITAPPPHAKLVGATLLRAPMQAQLTKLTLDPASKEQAAKDSAAKDPPARDPAANDPASISAQGQLQRWKEANALETDDSAPYYLRVNFELFDLDGKPVEKGTLERWAAPHRATTIISSPSVQRSSASPSQPLTRNSYLIDFLLDKLLRPVPTVEPLHMFKMIELERKFGQASLHCVTASADSATLGSPNFLVCCDPASEAIRIDGNSYATTFRNKEAKFRGKPVAMELSISFGPPKAIAGTVIELKGIEPNDTHLPPLDAHEPTPEHESLASGVTAGMKLRGDSPTYPYSAKNAHIQGTVLVAAVVSKQGTLNSLTVIASPSPSLSYAAVEALKTWTYKPYILNGNPTEVDTQVIINFYLTK